MIADERAMLDNIELYEQQMEDEELAKEVAEFFDETVDEVEETSAKNRVSSDIVRLKRQRNSRRKAASKNADFESKKASRKEAKIEKNSDSHGHCPMKPKQVSYFKTARRRAMRRKANKLVAIEE